MKLQSLFLIAATCGSLHAAPEHARPNLIFILTDDQRWDALGFMPGSQVQTPSIDKLAKEGVIFDNHFVTTSICCVSRASILTGQYARRHGIGDFATPLTDAQWKKTYPALLRENGYRTGFVGKFGVGNANSMEKMAANFDFWRGIAGQGGKYFIDPKDKTRKHQTALYGDQSLEFLDGCSKEKPFCLSVSFTAPHARDHMPREFTPDDRDASVYNGTTLTEPELAKDRYFKLLPKSVQTSEARTRWTWRFDTAEKFQKNTKDYFRLISGIDREVGRMMDKLKEKGFDDNTVVIYTSDNGYALGDRGLAGKWFMYEESLRDPLVIYDPRQPAEKRSRHEKAMTLNIDFAPTMLDLAGVKPPAGMQGRSLVPLIGNKTPADWRTEFFYEHHFGEKIIPPSEGVRTQRFTYLRWVNEKPPIEELYDLEKDPKQISSLTKSKEMAATLGELRGKWENYRKNLK